MNKKLSLLLASSIISVGIILNGSIVNAKMTKQSSNGAIIESWGLGIERSINNTNASDMSRVEKNYRNFETCINGGDFNKSEDYFIAFANDLVNIQNQDEATFNKYYNRALDFLMDVIDEYPTNAYPKYYLSKMYQIAEDYDKAFVFIKDCIDIDKKNPIFLYELGNLYLTTNQNEKAARVFEQLKLQYPREKEIRVALAQAYYNTASFDNSVREYRVAAAFEPEDSDTVAALVTASTYAKMVKNNTFYDPMQTVAATSAPSSGNKHDVIAFGAGSTSSFSASQPYTTSLKDAKGQSIKATPTTVGKVAEGQNYTLVNQRENVSNYTGEQTPQTRTTQTTTYQTGLTQAAPQTAYTQPSAPQTQATRLSQNVNKISTEQQQQMKNMGLKQVKPRTTRAASSNKRVMVSYINGRKVVKIVNISQDTDVSQTLSNSSQSLSRQLADSNSNQTYYDNNEQPNVQTINNGQYTFASYKNPSSSSIKKESDIFSSENQSYTTPKYNYNDKEYYSNDTGRNTADIQSPQEKQPRLVIPNKYGQKATTTNATSKTEQTVSEKTKKDKNKKNKDNKKVNETATQSQTSAENAELYLKANELLAQNQYQAVIDLLSKINPPTLRSLTSIASCYNALGNTDAAIEYYNKADKISPDNSQILFSLAYLYFSKNQVDTAKNYVNRSLQIDPNNANALQLKNFISQQDSNDDMNKAVSYMNSGNYSDSKKILDKLAQSDSSNFQVYYYLGHICYATQKYAEAVQDFLKAVKLNSEYALSYYSLGLAYDKLKKFNDSLASYERFIQMSTDDNKYTQYAKTRINTIKSKK